MSQIISISNYKSVVDLQFKRKRINLFLGEPNSGKSNILEAIGLFSLPVLINIGTIARFDRISNIFFDNDKRNEIKVVDGTMSLRLYFEDNKLIYSVSDNEGNTSRQYKIIDENIDKTVFDPSFDLFAETYKPYHFFTGKTSFSQTSSDYLLPPFGENLATVLFVYSQLREQVSELINGKGYRLNLDASRNEINMIKEEKGVFYTYPYHTFSDTLQRIIFYYAAIESNENSTLIFEEPEANTFPYYTKQLAERIALDQNNNQYFIATHNPYLLSSIVEKSPVADLAVNIVYMQDYKTQLYQLTDEQLSEVLDLGPDVFYNLERFLPEA